MAGYTRQSTFADGDTITAALFNNEYNQLVNALAILQVTAMMVQQLVDQL